MAVHHAGAEVLDENVGAAGERLEHLPVRVRVRGRGRVRGRVRVRGRP